MELSYKIEEQDYLAYQLYTASKSKLIKKKRRKNWILLPVIYGVFSVLAFSFGNQKSISLVFAILAVFWLISYPIYSKWMYKDRYKKFIKSNNKEMFGRPVTLSIEPKKLTIQDDKNESKIDISEVHSIHEIMTHVFLKLKTGSTLIIPKHELKDLTNLAKFIHQVTKASGVKIQKELDWKWK